MDAAKEKILLISHFFPPDFAGTGFVMEELARDLATSGRELTVLAGKTQRMSAYTQYQSPLTITRIRHGYVSKDRKVGRLLNYLSFPLAILCHPKLLKSVDTIIIVSTVPTTIGLSPILKKILKKRVIYIWQDIYPDLAVHLGVLSPRSLLTRAMHWLNRVSLRSVDHIVVLGTSMERYVINHYREWKHKVSVISNWEDPDEIAPLPKDNPWARVSNYYHKFVVLYSGNIGLFQNLDPIIEAAELLRGDADTVFLFVGSGGSKARLQALVKEKQLPNVDFMDYVDGHDYSYLLASADCHLVSLKKGMEQFGFPGKLYSSLAAGRPVIAITEQGTELGELLTKHGAGLVAESARQLAQHITALKKDDALRTQMGAHARELLLQHFARKKVTDQYVALLLKYSSRGGAPRRGGE